MKSTCTLVVVVKWYLANNNVMVLDQLPYSLDLSPPDFFLVSTPKKCSERMIHKFQGSNCKSNESTDIGIEK
jgi:hypothetical protein